MDNVKEPEGGIVTYTGRVVDPFNPDPKTICIEDVAHGLSLTCRFGGQCRTFYSVAQHSLVVGRIVPSHLAIFGLLHDAAEAYLTDIPRPFKSKISGYGKTEDKLLKTIFKAFQIPFKGLGKEIKDADNLALAIEQYELLPNTEHWPHILSKDEYDMYNVALGTAIEIPPSDVEEAFLERFWELKERIP